MPPIPSAVYPARRRRAIIAPIMNVHEIPTPALVVDLPAMDRNIRRAADYYASRICKLRPHFKAHKTPAIAKRQLAAGSCTGITCATIGEAEILVREGIDTEILIANEIVGPGKAARAAKLASQANLIVAIDSDLALDDLARAAQSAGTTVGVLIDVNVGLPRCGIAPGDPAVALAKRAAETPGITLRGARGSEGHVMAIRDRGEREEKAAKAMERLLSTVRMMREAGLRCEIVSAGGTCTFDITGAMEGITEVQAGTYVLMDNSYLYEDLPFELAFTIHATVLSRPRPEQCAVDAGLKACASDHGNPSLKDLPGANLLFLSDEHATIALPADSTLQPGDRIELLPSHIDPTINLYDALYAVENGEVVEVWPVAARGYPEHRQ
jgi:D-serine deaminase-like pyridoxal phosphate-dependent protein